MSVNPKAVPGLWTMQVGEREASLRALESAIIERGGNPRDLFDRFRTDRKYADRIAQAMMQKRLVSSIDLRMAKLVLGNNIFTAEDWVSYYGVDIPKKRIRQTLKFPGGEDILNSPCPFTAGKLVRETHFAFLGISDINGAPLTVDQWIEIYQGTDTIADIDQPMFHFDSDPWHIGQPCIELETLGFRWYLLFMGVVPGSTNKTPEMQMAMLPAEYEVPTAVVEITKNILVFRKTGKRANSSLFTACAGRTVKTDKISDGYVPCTGCFYTSGLNICNWNGSPNHLIGVGASRRLSTNLNPCQ